MSLDIVLFWCYNDWGKYGRAYEKIAENLARIDSVKRVLCLFPPMERDKLRKMINIVRINNKLFRIDQSKGFLKTEKKRPFRIRVRINNKTMEVFLKRILKNLGLRRENTILWVFPPHLHLDFLVKVVPHDCLVTQIVDNNSFMTNATAQSRSFASNQYNRLAICSDAVITSSQINWQLFSRLNENCMLFENAVDSIFVKEPTELPHRIYNCRPSLGYVGYITERTDLTLLEYIARKRPEYDIVIAGPHDKQYDMNYLSQLPNVTYIGAIPYEEVPQFIQTCDVCLIPHKDTAYSRSMSPLKLYQYLGSGRPIVSSRVAGVERFNELISVAHDYEEFVQYIDLNLENDSEVSRRKRIEKAKGETWEIRTRAMFDFVEKMYLAKRYGEGTSDKAK